MSDDYDYVANYIPERLYINPGSTGAFASIAGESEAIIGEVDVISVAS